MLVYIIRALSLADQQPVQAQKLPSTGNTPIIYASVRALTCICHCDCLVMCTLLLEAMGIQDAQTFEWFSLVINSILLMVITSVIMVQVLYEITHV